MSFVRSAWWNAYQAVARLPKLIGSSFVLFLLVNFIGFLVADRYGIPYFAATGGSHPTPEQLDGLVWLGLAGSIPAAGIRAAVAVSIHRYVLLGEVIDRIAVPQTLRDAKFACWLVLLTLLAQMPSVLQVMTGRDHRLLGQIASLPIVVVVVVTRLTLLFPAIALDRPHPLARGWHLSRWHVWRILWTTFLTALPLAAVLIPLGILGYTRHSTTLIALVAALDSSVIASALAAMASVFYRVYSAEAASRTSPEGGG